METPWWYGFLEAEKHYRIHDGHDNWTVRVLYKMHRLDVVDSLAYRVWLEGEDGRVIEVGSGQLDKAVIEALD